MSASDSPLLDEGRSSFFKQNLHQMGLPESIARNLLDRGESLGINKTFLSAVSELRVRYFIVARPNVPLNNSFSAIYLI